MQLFDKIRLNMLRNGKLKLQDLPIAYGFEEEFVEAALEGHGYKEFKSASEWIKGDAEFILRKVGRYPEILQDVEEVIYDRYVDDSGILREVEMDKFLFSTMCCIRNPEAFKYLGDEEAKKYLDAVKNSKTVTGEYHGENKEISLVYTNLHYDRLLYIKYGIIKLGDMIGSI